MPLPTYDQLSDTDPTQKTLPSFESLSDEQPQMSVQDILALGLPAEDEIVGGITTGIDVLRGQTPLDWEEIKNRYQSVRDQERMAQEQAKEENPLAFYGSKVLGTGLMARAGGPTAAGGITAWGESEAETPGGLATDTAIGAALGKGGQVAGKYIGDKIGSAKDFVTGKLASAGETVRSSGAPIIESLKPLAGQVAEKAAVGVGAGVGGPTGAMLGSAAGTAARGSVDDIVGAVPSQQIADFAAKTIQGPISTLARAPLQAAESTARATGTYGGAALAARENEPDLSTKIANLPEKYRTFLQNPGMTEKMIGASIFTLNQRDPEFRALWNSQQNEE